MYNTKEGKSCVIYIRVSSERQVKGDSLDGQKHYLAECAECRGMTVLDTYVEEGKQDEYILSEVISHEAFVSKEDFDKYAERRRADMTRRLNDLYDQIYKAEDLLQESLMKKATLESEQMSVQSMIGILSSFDAIYDRMNAGHLSKRWRCLKTAALIKVRS